MDVDPEIVRAAAEAIAKQLPIKEGLAPVAVPLGEILSDLVKTIQLALAPIQLAGAYQDRLRNFLDRAVRRVPFEKLVTPAAQILGPVIEGIRYEPEGTPIDEMFSELLSRAMDSERLGEAHPAFAPIIRQLSSDEARLLVAVYRSDSPPQFCYKMPTSNLRTWAGRREFVITRNDFETIEYPRFVPFYLDHLSQLHLLRQNGGIQRQGSIETYTEICDLKFEDFGMTFMKACCS